MNKACPERAAARGGSERVRTDFVICIVDDDEEVRDSIENFFRSAGIAVRTFDAAESLLASPDAAIMDLLITDLHMPGMDGLDLHRALLGRGRRIPVILMTAFPSDEVQKAALALGVSIFLTKPADPETLFEHAAALLSSEGDDDDSKKRR